MTDDDRAKKLERLDAMKTLITSHMDQYNKLVKELNLNTFISVQFSGQEPYLVWDDSIAGSDWEDSASDEDDSWHTSGCSWNTSGCSY